MCLIHSHPFSPCDSVRCIHTIPLHNSYSWPGSNWRPSACEADVIATRPQVPECSLSNDSTSASKSSDCWRGTSIFQESCARQARHPTTRSTSAALRYRVQMFSGIGPNQSKSNPITFLFFVLCCAFRAAAMLCEMSCKKLPRGCSVTMDGSGSTLRCPCVIVME